MSKKEDDAVVDGKPRETPVEFLASLAEVLIVALFIMAFVLQGGT